jgi:hypothetical protein
MASGAAGVFVASLALLVSGGSLYVAYETKQRLDQQDKVQVAAKVLLEEAPVYAAKEHPVASNHFQYVVLNGSATQIDDVWVEGSDGRSVNIQGIQSCTMYSLPDGFRALAVNFRDAQGRWRRGLGSAAPSPDGKEMPARDTDDSPWLLDVHACN